MPQLRSKTMCSSTTSLLGPSIVLDKCIKVIRMSKSWIVFRFHLNLHGIWSPMLLFSKAGSTVIYISKGKKGLVSCHYQTQPETLQEFSAMLEPLTPSASMPTLQNNRELNMLWSLYIPLRRKFISQIWCKFLLHFNAPHPIGHKVLCSGIRMQMVRQFFTRYVSPFFNNFYNCFLTKIW